MSVFKNFTVEKLLSVKKWDLRGRLLLFLCKRALFSKKENMKQLFPHETIVT